MKRLILLMLTTITLATCFKVEAQAKEIIRIPQEVVKSCEKWGDEYGICPELLEAMCWHETRCRSNLENGGCLGMTQINPKFHKETMELLGVTDLTDYDQNIHVCAYTIAEYAKQEEDLYCVLMMWNCGSNRGRELFYKDVFTTYAKEVSEESRKLEEMHGKIGEDY